MTEQQAFHLDGGDLGCDRPLILLRNPVAELPPWSAVHLTTAGPVAPIDLPAWCRMTGHTHLGPVLDHDTATYVVQTSADPTPTRPERPWHPLR